MRSTEGAGGASPGSAASQDFDAFRCQWEADLARAGVVRGPSWALNIGVPGLTLAILALALVLAIVAPDPDRGPAPLGIALLLAAAAPWVPWLLHGDDGPTWTFVALALAPVAALGVGHWFVDSIGLGSAVAYPLLAFPGLLLTILVIAAASPPIAIGTVVAAWGSFGGPLLAAAIAGRDVAATDVVTWHVVMVLSVAAGYAVRYSHGANAAVTAAREALAWQAAADERRQVARDVHDVVAHTLAVTMLHITGARMAVLRGAPDVAVEALEEAERQGRASLADIRRIVRMLRADDASALDAVQPGLADVEALIDRYRSAGLAVDLALTVDRPRSSPSAELALYRVLQEALTNAARHGDGSAAVQLLAVPDRMVLRIDNPVSPAPAASLKGSGLAGMRERVAAAGGTIEAGIRNGRWVVRATIPDGVAL
jgi:signal transduction histidine kinase